MKKYVLIINEYKTTNKNELAQERTDMALERTKLANQRTYLAYFTTGLVISAIAGTFQKNWIAIFGIIMILGSTFQYFIINKNLDEGKVIDHRIINVILILYLVLSLGALYLQMTARKK